MYFDLGIRKVCNVHMTLLVLQVCLSSINSLSLAGSHTSLVLYKKLLSLKTLDFVIALLAFVNKLSGLYYTKT